MYTCGCKNVSMGKVEKIHQDKVCTLHNTYTTWIYYGNTLKLFLFPECVQKCAAHHVLYKRSPTKFLSLSFSIPGTVSYAWIYISTYFLKTRQSMEKQKRNHFPNWGSYFLFLQFSAHDIRKKESLIVVDGLGWSLGFRYSSNHFILCLFEAHRQQLRTYAIV